MTKATPVTLVIADDHTLFRDGMRALLEIIGGYRIVGETSTGRETVDVVEALRPTLVLMDIAMPNLNGVEAARQILQRLPATKIIFISAHSDDEYIARATEVGAAGFILKHASTVSFTRALGEVVAGRTYFSPAIAKRIRQGHLDQLNRPGLNTGPGKRLTTREQEVLQRVAEGAANKQIAAELGISIKTVEKHRQQLMDKLDIHETAGLTRYAIATGVIENRVRIPNR